MEYYLRKRNLWERYHHNKKKIKEAFLEFFKSFIKQMSNPTVASQILEQDAMNMDHLCIVVIQQEEMLHKKTILWWFH